MEEMVETVTISEETYIELMDKVNFLNALEAVGVDNWSGYEEAQNILEDLYEK